MTSAIDLLLGGEKGNSSCAFWPDALVKGLYLEVIYLLECIAPPALHVDRFLPPTPLRIIVDHQGEDQSARIGSEMLVRHLKPGDVHRLLGLPGLRAELLPRLLDQAGLLAERRVPATVAQASQDMNCQLGQEHARLVALRKVNPNVRIEELEALAQQQHQLGQHLSGARLRLESVRLIHRGPASAAAQR